MSNGGGFLWANKNTVAAIQAAAQNAGTGYITSLARCCIDNKLVTPDHKNFAPRIGISWRPLPSDRFVIRAGYGIFYDLQNQWYGLTTYDNISTLIGSSAFYPTSTGQTPTAPNPLDSLWLPSTVDFSFFGVGPNAFPYWIPYPQINWPGNRTPYNQQWTLGGQYALKQNLVLDVSYVASHSLRQPGYWYYNAATMTSVDDPCNRYRTADEAAGDPTCAADPNFVPALARNRFPNISSHAYAVANLFSGNYNSPQVRLNQRLSQGLLYQLNYTWSRTFDNVSAINNIPTGSLTLQNNNCFSCDRGPASFDQPSRFVASGSYELPVGKGRKWSLGPANWIVGGWNFSGIYTVASGMPETLFAGLGGYGQDGVRADLRRPNQVGNPNASVSGLDPNVYEQANFKSNVFHWFNPAAYAIGAWKHLWRCRSEQHPTAVLHAWRHYALVGFPDHRASALRVPTGDFQCLLPLALQHKWWAQRWRRHSGQPAGTEFRLAGGLQLRYQWRFAAREPAVGSAATLESSGHSDDCEVRFLRRPPHRNEPDVALRHPALLRQRTDPPGRVSDLITFSTATRVAFCAVCVVDGQICPARINEDNDLRSTVYWLIRIT